MTRREPGAPGKKHKDGAPSVAIVQCRDGPPAFHNKLGSQIFGVPRSSRFRDVGPSLLHEVHVTVPLQEFKITHPVKIILRAQFHLRVLDDLG